MTTSFEKILLDIEDKMKDSHGLILDVMAITGVNKDVDIEGIKAEETQHDIIENIELIAIEVTKNIQELKKSIF
jgi:hypothetical protein